MILLTVNREYDWSVRVTNTRTDTPDCLNIDIVRVIADHTILSQYKAFINFSRASSVGIAKSYLVSAPKVSDWYFKVSTTFIEFFHCTKFGIEKS